MATLAQLVGLSDQLLAAVKSLCTLDSGDAEFMIQNPDADTEINQAKATIFANAEAIKTLVQVPTDFLQKLASQVEVLSCLYWLAEYQILACIPPDQDISIKDLAELTEVPREQLYRIICMTATSGFLRVISCEMVAHTPLSVQFMASQSLLDAVVFMAETVAPTALHMPSAARDRPRDSAYNLAKNDSSTFSLAYQTQRKLGRQWAAYLQYAAGLHQGDEVVSVLSQLNWSNLGDACIVEVGAVSTTIAQYLVKQYPKLRLVVQMQVTSGFPQLPLPLQEGDGQQRITVTYGASSAAPQTITDAAAYILHLPPKSAEATSGGTIRTLLQAYLSVLRISGSVLLIPTSRFLPEPGSFSDPGAEAVARTRDLSMLQLFNEGEMALADLLQIIATVSDSMGKLVVANELHASNGAALAVIIKHAFH
ncbi:hypothetical protein EYB25_000711 [Talaromyces marneffei]|uniref:O-methyltransferase n=2 Tax=Talaromyces marneffei TaxID=37727 RepID=B6Q534_TALMQ|nr:uncharacterized protein EYB26_001622 [Talaromyces marneffei]EEA28353.1 conserved hypothetical protein [Talaromyces marneffei ATCC 18224]KAE8556012.1 hypothetical protein EYB25_000711 [Talaromyces marneffei]QGA13970.1 hypothetical protein EYB26_001622 [Talaromyces marneffei]